MVHLYQDIPIDTLKQRPMSYPLLSPQGDIATGRVLEEACDGSRYKCGVPPHT